MGDNARNFPPSVPIDKPSQFQKTLFPFAAFSSDDPNTTANPVLTLLAPWLMSGTFKGTGTALVTALVDTAANLASANPTPLQGQIAYETDTLSFKIGDGTTAYNSLSYQPQFGKVAPLPQSAAGVGQVIYSQVGNNADLNVPSGGTWMILGGLVWTNAGVVEGPLGAGVAAGGFLIRHQGATENAYDGFYKILASPDIDFTQPVYLRDDGTFVVTLVSGHPYHVIDTLEYAAKWQRVQAWLAAGNTAQPYVPPAPVPPDLVAQANATLQTIMLKYVNSIMVGPSAPLQFAAQWLAAWKAAGN